MTTQSNAAVVPAATEPDPKPKILADVNLLTTPEQEQSQSAQGQLQRSMNITDTLLAGFNDSQYKTQIATALAGVVVDTYATLKDSLQEVHEAIGIARTEFANRRSEQPTTDRLQEMKDLFQAAIAMTEADTSHHVNKWTSTARFAEQYLKKQETPSGGGTDSALWDHMVSALEALPEMMNSVNSICSSLIGCGLPGAADPIQREVADAVYDNLDRLNAGLVAIQPSTFSHRSLDDHQRTTTVLFDYLQQYEQAQSTGDS